jgi:hypothetical protein
VPAISSEPAIIGATAFETRGVAVDSRLAVQQKSTIAPGSTTRSKKLSSAEQARLAALLTFCDPLPHDCSRLQALSLREWTKLLRWLDISGLALYFVDHLSQTGRASWLPAPIADGLQRRLEENTERTASMLAESIAIQREFQEAGLSYALLKGMSFWPNSVPRPELRSQFDLDYLVAENHISEARRILARIGYRLYLSNGRSWEFKKNERPGVMLKEMYRDTGAFRVEVHAQPTGTGSASPLQTLEWRELGGFAMPVLSPVELFLGQGMHAFKHICSEFVRAAHLLEFRRHALFRHDDPSFWCALRERAGAHPRVVMGLGITTFLITRVMGEFAPETLTSWTVDRLPPRVKLWIEMYGDRAVLGSFPGSKLYMLLKRELEEQASITQFSGWRALVPHCLPQPIIRANPNESLSVRFGRYRMQLALINRRLRFHFIEGLRFAREAHRWRRLLSQGS